MAADENSHDHWQKTKKLLKIRKIREEKYEREHAIASDNYARAQVELQKMRDGVDQFIDDRNAQLTAMRQSFYVNGATGVQYERMLYFEEETRLLTNEKLHEIAMAALQLEELGTQVQLTYHAWQPARNARTKIEHIVGVKKEEASTYAELQEEERNADVPPRRPNI